MDKEIIISINKYHSFFKGLINYMEGGTTFRWVSMQKFRSVWYQVEKDLELREVIQNSGRQKQKCNLDPSAVFTCVDNYLSAELTQSARGNAITKMSAFIAVIWISHALNKRCHFCLVCPQY